MRLLKVTLPVQGRQAVQHQRACGHGDAGGDGQDEVDDAADCVGPEHEQRAAGVGDTALA